MKIAIVGSSQLIGAETDAAEKLVQLIVMANSRWSGCVLVSGGATGIDSIAELEASLNNWQTEIYLPENNRWEPDGYKDRNMKIAEACHVLYCIRSRNSNTYGSGWTADYAEKLGRVVWRFFV